VKFLATLRRYRHKSKVSLVQLGDMYDLWIGLQKCFVESDPGEFKLVGEKVPCSVVTETNDLQMRDESFTGFEFVKHWIEKTHETNPEVAAAFRDFAGDVDTFFLAGNHDDYLVHDAVYPPDPRGYRNMVFDSLGQTRQREVHDDGLFLEHGHYLDQSNRDGATAGHDMTQLVFDWDFMRSLDPDRRRIWIVGAAARFMEHRQRRPFFLYAMAHTHSPFLCEVSLRQKVAPKS